MPNNQPPLLVTREVAEKIVALVCEIETAPDQRYSRAVSRLLHSAALRAEQRCDCGAKLTSCHDCAVGDYQAAHPACEDCCPAQTHAEKLATVALNQVSHDADGRCLWCRRAEHTPNCLRQAAMRLLSPPLR